MYTVLIVFAVDRSSLSIQFRQNSDIDMDFVIDIHAHSAATNGFMYCNAVQEGSDFALVSKNVNVKRRSCC